MPFLQRWNQDKSSKAGKRTQLCLHRVCLCAVGWLKLSQKSICPVWSSWLLEHWKQHSVELKFSPISKSAQFTKKKSENAPILTVHVPECKSWLSPESCKHSEKCLWHVSFSVQTNWASYQSSHLAWVMAVRNTLQVSSCLLWSLMKGKRASLMTIKPSASLRNHQLQDSQKCLKLAGSTQPCDTTASSYFSDIPGNRLYISCRMKCLWKTYFGVGKHKQVCFCVTLPACCFPGRNNQCNMNNIYNQVFQELWHIIWTF